MHEENDPLHSRWIPAEEARLDELPPSLLRQFNVASRMASHYFGDKPGCIDRVLDEAGFDCRSVAYHFHAVAATHCGHGAPPLDADDETVMKHVRWGVENFRDAFSVYLSPAAWSWRFVEREGGRYLMLFNVQQPGEILQKILHPHEDAAGYELIRADAGQVIVEVRLDLEMLDALTHGAPSRKSEVKHEQC